MFGFLNYSWIWLSGQFCLFLLPLVLGRSQDYREKKKYLSSRKDSKPLYNLYIRFIHGPEVLRQQRGRIRLLWNVRNHSSRKPCVSYYFPKVNTRISLVPHELQKFPTLLSPRLTSMSSFLNSDRSLWLSQSIDNSKRDTVWLLSLNPKGQYNLCLAHLLSLSLSLSMYISSYEPHVSSPLPWTRNVTHFFPI